MSDDPHLPVLVEIGGRHSGREHRLALGEHTVGRDPEVSVRLDHPDVSRRHARVQVSMEAVTVADLDSKNGVWISGQRVDGPRVWDDGERLELGELALELRHPASRVSRALAAAGEATVTHRRAFAGSAPEPRPAGLRGPLIAAALFTLAMIALWLWG